MAGMARTARVTMLPQKLDFGMSNIFLILQDHHQPHQPRKLAVVEAKDTFVGPLFKQEGCVHLKLLSTDEDEGLVVSSVPISIG